MAAALGIRTNHYVSIENSGRPQPNVNDLQLCTGSAKGDPCNRSFQSLCVQVAQPLECTQELDQDSLVPVDHG